MNTLSRFAVGALAMLGTAAPALAADLDKVSFGTNWLAEAEHGGFYQAVADGTYKKYGLDVTIVQGGPQAANQQLLIAGKIDFYMGGTLGAFDRVKEGIPVIDVAAIFQKDPQVFMAHPDAPYATFADLAKAPVIFMSKDLYAVQFSWMKAAFDGFKDDQYKPYTFNPAPFIANAASVQQGYVTSEPYTIEKQSGLKPEVFLLADSGYPGYAAMVLARNDLIAGKPEVVKAFVAASAAGWKSYLTGDAAAADAMIRKDNPEMTQDILDQARAKLKSYGIVESGDTATGGVGVMPDARWKSFFDMAAGQGIYPSTLDVHAAYSLDFLPKGT